MSTFEELNEAVNNAVIEAEKNANLLGFAANDKLTSDNVFQFRTEPGVDASVDLSNDSTDSFQP